MKHVMLQTLRQRRTSTIWWCVGIIVFVSLVMLVYPVFRDQSAELDKALSGISDTSKALFTDTESLTSPVGYLDSNLYYLMLPLVFSVLAIGLGSSLIAQEERDHTIELLLSRPVSRRSLLIGKALAGLIIITIVAFVAAACGAVEVQFIDFGSIGIIDIFAVTFMSALLAIIFGALAFALQGTGKLGRASIGIASFVAFASYLFTSLAGTVTWLHWPAHVLPFDYFHPADLLNGTFNWGVTISFVAVTLGLGAIAYLGFRHRDIE